MFPALKNNAAAGYKVAVKIEVLKGTALLNWDARIYPNTTQSSLCCK